MPAAGPRSLAAPTSSDMTRRRPIPDHAERAAPHGPTTRWPGAGRPKKTVSIGSPSSSAVRDHSSLGELERERAGREVEPAPDEREPHRGLPVHEAAGVVDEVQPSVLGHAVRPDLDGVDAVDGQTLDRGDGNPGDARFAGGLIHASILATCTRPAPCALLLYACISVAALPRL